jgi:hypothetical protein
MKFNYKKIASVFASAVMLSSTVGFAAAAAYPMPFVSGGVGDGAVIVGANADVRDWTAGMSLQTDLNSGVSGTAGSSVSGTAWQVKTSSDSFELGESIYDVKTYIDKEDLPILSDGEISNEKGTAKYEQFLYFDDQASTKVDYQEDDEENIGLMMKINSDLSFARYRMDFTVNLKSDITTADVLEDIEDETITLLGKTYTITKAVNTTTGTQLTLMSGADKTTVANGEEIVVGGKAVSVTVTSTTAAEFTVDGETTNAMDKGDTYKLDDGTYIGVSKITYQNFAGGIMQASFYLGADKIQMNNGSSMEVNAEVIDEAVVTISETISGGDISISEISVNMTAEDDLYIPVDGKLSEAENLNEPQALFSQNWDIEFKGLEAAETEDMKLFPSGSDKKYSLTMTNIDGNTFDIPLFYSNNSGIFTGAKASEELRLIPNVTNVGVPADQFGIDKGDYFILNTADPRVPGNNAKSFLVQYTGSNKLSTTSSSIATFDVKGVGEKTTSIGSDGNFSLTLGGKEFNFANVSDPYSNNYKIALIGDAYYDAEHGGRGPWEGNESVSVYLRTKSNALVNFTNSVVSNHSDAVLLHSESSYLYLNVTVDDANKDGDDITLSQSSSQEVFGVTFNHSQDADATASVSGDGAWISDKDNSDITRYITQYGAEITATDPDSSPVTIEATIPESVVEPLVYISSGEITVTTGSTGTGGQVLFVNDNKVDSVKDMNLIVVGGSCINTVAAKILDSTSPLCGADFTAKTNVGAGQYIIKTVESPYNAEKIAMLVAGYEAAETESAVEMAKTASTELGEQVYPITGTA